MIAAKLAWVLAFCTPGASITNCTPVMTAPTEAKCRAALVGIHNRQYARCLRMRLDKR